MFSNDFYKALKENDTNLLITLIQDRFEINKKDELGFTPLMLACENNLNAFAEILLKNGADPNLANVGTTALMIASSNDNYELVELLIKYKANVNSRDVIGQTPLKIATQKDNQKIIHLLQVNGARE